MPHVQRPRDTDESAWDHVPFSAPSHFAHTQNQVESTDDVLAAFATVSRRINDLARELKCLGYFDDDCDRPRAA